MHSEAHGLIGEMLLRRRDVLLLDADFLQSADGHEGFAHPILHPFNQRAHGHEAGDAKDDAEHGEDRAGFVRPDFLEADGDGVEQVHRTNAERGTGNAEFFRSGASDRAVARRAVLMDATVMASSSSASDRSASAFSGLTLPLSSNSSIQYPHSSASSSTVPILFTKSAGDLARLAAL